MTIIILTFALFISVNAVPSEVAKISVLNGQNQEENHNGNVHDISVNSKATNFNLDDVFKKGAKNDHAQANEEGKYDVVSSDKNHHLDKSDFADQNFNQQEGGAVSNLNKNLSSKKGHHNSGFRNTYHKDESSNKSSYYDDNDEQGRDFAQNSKNRAYGNRQSSNDGSSHLDNSFRLNGNREAGDYNNGRNYDRRFGNNNKNYNEGYYTNRENLDNVRHGNRHGLNGNFYDQQFHQHNPNFYHEPLVYDSKPRGYNRQILFNAYNRPGKNTITVYEDPRVYQHNFDYYQNPSYHHDNVELDVVPPFHRGYSNYDSIRRGNDFYY